MKLLVAYVHPEKVSEVETALAAIDIRPACGSPATAALDSQGLEFTVLSRIRIELTVSDYCVERAIRAILHATRMATCSDARVFVLPAPEGPQLGGAV